MHRRNDGSLALRVKRTDHRLFRSTERNSPSAYTSTSLAGSLSAVSEGLGIAVLPREMVPDHLTSIAGEADLPSLYDTEIALIEAAGLSDTAHRLAQHVVAALERGS